jgi:hypothetical protein
MADTTPGSRPGRHRAPLRPAGSWTGRRPAASLALTGVVLSGLLVRPVLCWADGQETPVAVAAEQPVVVMPVPRELREGNEVPPPRAVDVGAVLAEVDAAAARSRARVGAVVVDDLGRTLVASGAADRTVPTASLVKLLVVERVLAHAAEGAAPLDERTRRLMERAVTASDDDAMSALWDAHDGEALVGEAAAVYGLTGTAPPAEPGQWGETTTTPTDVARFLSALDRAPGAELLLGWMRAPAVTATDGFNQRFGLFGDPGVALKQGWMCCVDRRRQLHSAGVLADGRVVVVLADAPVTTPWSGLRRAVDGATAALVAGTA